MKFIRAKNKLQQKPIAVANIAGKPETARFIEELAFGLKLELKLKPILEPLQNEIKKLKQLNQSQEKEMKELKQLNKSFIEKFTIFAQSKLPKTEPATTTLPTLDAPKGEKPNNPNAKPGNSK